MTIQELYEKKTGLPAPQKHMAPMSTICTPEIFFKKYQKGDETVQKLISTLQQAVSCVQWFKESGRENEAIAIDFVDSLNVLSGEI